MTNTFDKQKDIEAEGQRAAVWYAKQENNAAQTRDVIFEEAMRQLHTSVNTRSHVTLTPSQAARLVDHIKARSA